MDWNEFYEEKIGLKRFVDIISGQQVFLQKILHYARGKRLLETGVGSGIVSTYLSSLGFQIAGIDRDRKIIRNVADLHGSLRDFAEPARLINADLFHLPFRGRSFDLCFHQGVLEHFDRATIIKALHEQLRVCETVVLSVPSELYPQRDFGDENLWSVETWRSLLSPFVIVDEFGYNLDFKYPHLIPLLRGVMPLWLIKFLHLEDISRAREIGFVIRRAGEDRV